MYDRRLSSVRFALFAIVLAVGAKTTFGQFDDLMLRVPGGANSLVLIDVDAFYSSPMAMRLGWKATFERKWAEQPILLPPEAKRFILASHLDPLNNMRSSWEVAIVDLATPVPMNTIARAEGGYQESIDSTPVVWTPSHAYCVQLDDQLLGIVYPDDRQAAARLISLGKTGQLTPISPYLKAATKKLRSAGQIVMAIDLTNVAQPHRIDQALKESKVLEGKNVSPTAVAQVLSSLKGVTVAINFQSQALTEVRVDFGSSIRSIKPFAKDLVATAMSRLGMPLEDVSAWKLSFDGDTFVFRGQLSERGLRRVSSFLELPTSKFSTLAKESESKVDPQKATLDASLRYFKMMEKLLDDLRAGLNTDAKILWYEKTARKIDQMPILHVDDELLAFGANTAQAIRQTAEQGRNIGRANSANQVAAIASYGNYYNNGYGGSGYSGSAQAYPSIQIDANNASSQNRTRGLQAMNNGLADIRRRMTKKYQVEF
ncbi:MAG TPA: hypothetical protein VFG04_20555 [Planctomycetaceae bacterium]|jgi:hypothetical protein|nr:hypothetical protein [Planctomycetaceae bacterium]